MSAFGKFLNNIVRYGLEYFGLYYSFYDAVVTDNQDPKKMGRVRFRCAELELDTDYWAIPLGYANGGGGGDFGAPPVGSHVCVRFKYGNIRNAYYERAYAYEKDYPSIGRENYTERWGHVTPSGHYIYFDDQQGRIEVRLNGGNGIAITNDGVEIAATGSIQEPVVLGDKNAQVHSSVQSILSSLLGALVTMLTALVAVTLSNAVLAPLNPAFTTALNAIQPLVSQASSLTGQISATKSTKNKTD